LANQLPQTTSLTISMTKHLILLLVPFSLSLLMFLLLMLLLMSIFILCKKLLCCIQYLSTAGA